MIDEIDTKVEKIIGQINKLEKVALRDVQLGSNKCLFLFENWFAFNALEDDMYFLNNVENDKIKKVIKGYLKDFQRRYYRRNNQK